MLHGQPNPLGHGQFWPPAAYVLQRLYDDKHVVDADAEEEERNDGVEVRSEEQPHVEGNAKRGRHTKPDHSQAHHREENPLLDGVESPQDKGDVEEDEGGADEEDGEVAVDAIVNLIVEALLGVGVDLRPLRLPIWLLGAYHNLDEVVLPVLRDWIRGLEWVS